MRRALCAEQTKPLRTPQTEQSWRDEFSTAGRFRISHGENEQASFTWIARRGFLHSAPREIVYSISHQLHLCSPVGRVFRCRRCIHRSAAKQTSATGKTD